MKPENTTTILTVKEAAEHWKISYGSLVRMIHANEIPFIQIGKRSYRLREEDFIQAMTAARPKGPVEKLADMIRDFPAEDIWEMEYTKHALPTKFIPLGTIVTVFGTGSEMNNGAVISRRETKEKYPFYGNYPLFSILDPEKTFTLPQRQVACGLADTFVHVMEQYMTVAGQSRVMDRWAEGILQTLVEIAPEIRENQHDYDLMADFMLSATMGLNGFIAMGVAQDWATHMIGHELTALHGLTHGATLAIVLPGTLRVLSAQKGDKLLQYGERVWGITTGERDERIRLAIERTEGFFRSLGLSTRLSEEGIGEETIAEIERRFDARGARYGEARNVDGAMARRILEACR